MYAFYYIWHVVFLICLLSFSALLFRRSMERNVPVLFRRRYNIYRVLKWSIIGVFAVLTAAQAQHQFGGDVRFANMRSIFDRREWFVDSYIQKGGILDRSGRAERALALSVKDQSGSYVREYPFGKASGHLVGYSSRTRGRSGLEAAFMLALTGSSSGHIENWPEYVRQRVEYPEPRGSSIILTIDSRLQRAGYGALAGRRGALVVLDPDTGEILALCSSPGFSPEDAESDSAWSTLLALENEAPFFNRALQGLYPPGSIFKIVTAAAALEHSVERTYFSGPDGFLPEGSLKTVHEHEYEEYSARGEKWIGHGFLDMQRALQKSSNVYFANLGCELGANLMSEMANTCGFNDLIKWNTASSELESWFPMKKSFFPGYIQNQLNLAWASIGQHTVLVSPLYMALLTAAAANGGKLMRPSLELGRYPKIHRRIFSKRTSGKLRKMMRVVVENGTGYRANVPGIYAAGKTGTAEVGDGRPHSWFVSFAPYEKPKLVVVAVIENGGYGGVSAARAVRAVLTAAKGYGYFN